MKKNAAILIIGPSGSGKTSLLERAISELPYLEDLITYTTRQKRQGEAEGNPYHFIEKQDFEARIEQGFFVEWAKVHDKMYGSSNEQFISAWQRQKVIIMDVDVQGAATIKQKYPQAFSIFILPPSIEALRQRIQQRDGDNVKDLELRMQNAEKEMQLAGNFDASLINNDYEASYAELKNLIEDYLKSE